MFCARRFFVHNAWFRMIVISNVKIIRLSGCCLIQFSDHRASFLFSRCLNQRLCCKKTVSPPQFLFIYNYLTARFNKLHCNSLRNLINPKNKFNLLPPFYEKMQKHLFPRFQIHFSCKCNRPARFL